MEFTAHGDVDVRARGQAGVSNEVVSHPTHMCRELPDHRESAATKYAQVAPGRLRNAARPGTS